MPGIRYELSAHAATVLAEREIEPTWLERVPEKPERTGADRTDPALVHALGPIRGRDDRVLRVVYNPAMKPLRIVTAYSDRRQRGQI
jgi:hypothetical protein